jgi:hypothetical protein
VKGGGKEAGTKDELQVLLMAEPILRFYVNDAEGLPVTAKSLIATSLARSVKETLN